jgi:membrane protein DedA with SNARE-associated domain
MAIELFSLETIQEVAHRFGYAAVFLGILIENTGVPVPGETMTLVGGFLAGGGELKYWGVLLSAIAGAVIGDSCGYWLGVYGGWPLMVRLGNIFRISEERLEQVKGEFSRNAPQAVFLGRFVTLLRIFAGPLAGIAQMPYPQFLLYNVSGATLWALTMVSLAYFVGQLVPLEKLLTWVTEFGVFALVLVIAAIALQFWLSHRSTLTRQDPSVK